jgi:hypothetical protein
MNAPCREKSSRKVTGAISRKRPSRADATAAPRGSMELMTGTSIV